MSTLETIDYVKTFQELKMKHEQRDTRETTTVYVRMYGHNGTMSLLVLV